MNACMLAYTFYENDMRVRRYAEVLVKQGHNVDVISLRRRGAGKYEELNGVRIYKIQERVLNEKGRLVYLYRLLKFLLLSAGFLWRKHVKNPYDLIHVHSVPDFEVFAALLPKLDGAKIILDIHDIVPEFYASKFDIRSKTSIIYRVLTLMERISIAFSDHVIISNHIWYNTLVLRSVKHEKCTAIINYPDTSVFYRRNPLPLRRKIIMLYPGGLYWHQGLDIAVKALSMIKDKATALYLHIYGSGPEENALKSLINELGMGKRVLLKKGVAVDEVAHLMSNADIGIVPKRNDPFGGQAFSTKVLEFMSIGTPVIVSRTMIDQYYFDESLVQFFDPDDYTDLADSIMKLITDEQRRKTLSRNGLNFVEKNNWNLKQGVYLNLVNSLVGKK